MLAENPFIASDTQLPHYSSFCSFSHTSNLYKMPMAKLIFFPMQKRKAEKIQLSNASITNNYKLTLSQSPSKPFCYVIFPDNSASRRTLKHLVHASQAIHHKNCPSHRKDHDQLSCLLFFVFKISTA